MEKKEEKNCFRFCCNYLVKSSRFRTVSSFRLKKWYFKNVLVCVPASPVPVDGPGDGAPFPKVNNGVDENGPADVAAPAGAVPKPVRPLCDVKQADVRPDRLARLAHLDEHVAVHLGQFGARYPRPRIRGLNKQTKNVNHQISLLKITIIIFVLYRCVG